MYTIFMCSFLSKFFLFLEFFKFVVEISYRFFKCAHVTWKIVWIILKIQFKHFLVRISERTSHNWKTTLKSWSYTHIVWLMCSILFCHNWLFHTIDRSDLMRLLTSSRVISIMKVSCIIMLHIQMKIKTHASRGKLTTRFAWGSLCFSH